MDEARLETVRRRDLNDLANALATTLAETVDRGMAPDEAASVAAAVAADFGRAFFGDGYLPGLADIVQSQAGRPLAITRKSDA